MTSSDEKAGAAPETPKVRVHRNLHRAKAGGAQWVLTHGGKVAEYLSEIALTGVTTRVQEAGQRKCRETQVRSVCGFLDGERTRTVRPGPDWKRIGFDPRSESTFKADGEVWNQAEAVVLCEDGSAWVMNPVWVDR